VHILKKYITKRCILKAHISKTIISKATYLKDSYLKSHIYQRLLSQKPHISKTPISKATYLKDTHPKTCLKDTDLKNSHLKDLSFTDSFLKSHISQRHTSIDMSKDTYLKVAIRHIG
jgi:hypothetical protein